MANKLKDIFSTDPPEYESTLKFRDNDAYRNFRAAIDAVEKDGCLVSVDGVESVSMYLQDHGIRFPIEEHKDITEFFIGPAIEPFDYSVINDGIEKTYHFNRYRIKDGIVLETAKNEVIYLKLLFSEITKRVNITYQIQYQYAGSVSEIVSELNALICFLFRFHPSFTGEETNGEESKVKKIFQYLHYTEGFMSRLCKVEKTLGLRFSPTELHSISSEDQQEIEELFLLLCKGIPLRLNARINSTDATNIEMTNVQKELTVGSKIALVFVSDTVYDLLGQSFKIYTANAVFNAIIKAFDKSGDKTTVYYGDTDSQPMYISYSAYLNEDDAREEAERNLATEEKYIKALTGVQHMKNYLVQ